MAFNNPAPTNFYNMTHLHGSRLGLSTDDALMSYDSVLILPKGFISRGVADVTITSAQLLALNATPVTIIPAQGANTIIVPQTIIAQHAGGTAYAGIAAGEDIQLKYTNGSGAAASPILEITGFLDQTTAQRRLVGNDGATITPVVNAAIVAHMLAGEITTGNFALDIRVFYDVVTI